MIEIIVSDYEGNLTISDDMISGDKPFTLTDEEGGRRTLFKGEGNYEYYKTGRILIISVLNSKGSIELVGKFTKPIQVYLYDREVFTVYPSVNFKSEQLEIRHLHGGFNALVSNEPASWE